MKLTYETDGVGRYAAPRIRVLKDGAVIGFADWAPITDSWQFEKIVHETEGQTMLRAQRIGASEKRMGEMLAERDALVVNAILSVSEDDAVKKYLRELPAPVWPAPTQETGRTLDFRPTLEPIPLPAFHVDNIAEIAHLTKQVSDLKSDLQKTTDQANTDRARVANLEYQLTALTNRLEASEQKFQGHLSTCPKFHAPSPMRSSHDLG